MPASKPSPPSARRIGLVRRGYSASGGAERYLRGFAQAAVAAGHEVILFASPEWEDWTYGEQITVAGRSPASFSTALEALQPRERCDVLFSLERVSSCDIYRAGDGVHAAWLERRGRFENALKRLSWSCSPKHRSLTALEKAAMTGARQIIANSRMVRDEIERFYGREVAGKVRVVCNGIDAARWATPLTSREEFRSRLNLSSNEKVAAFVGSGWERKGLRFAIEAAKMAGATLLVSGQGRLKNCPAHVRLLGTTENVVDVLHASDAFILPTLYDPFSNATLEALAAGLPVITTRANGVSEILDPAIDGTAVADPADIALLAAALVRWLPDDRRSLRHQRAAAFSLEKNFSETIRIIES